MRILMLLWDFWPGPEGGAERQCRSLSRALVASGHRVTVVCARTVREGPVLDDGVEIHRLGPGIPSRMEKQNKRERWVPGTRIAKLEPVRRAVLFWLGLPQRRKSKLEFYRELKAWFISLEEKPDLIHVHESGWLAGAARSLGAPVLAKIRSTPALDAVGYDVPERRFFERMREGCHWQALHADHKRELMEAGVEESRITVIPNAVDLPARIPKPEGNPPMALCVGNLTQGAGLKGFDVLMRAWGVLHRKIPAATLAVLGRGDPEIWIRLAEACGCGASVTFPGFVEDLSPWYRQASLFVLPSNREGMSNALLEAQARGLPAVVSDIPANRAVVLEGQTGVFFPPGNAGALADILASLIQEPGMLKKQGEAAYRHVQQSFSRPVVVSRMLDAYQQLKGGAE